MPNLPPLPSQKMFPPKKTAFSLNTATNVPSIRHRSLPENTNKLDCTTNNCSLSKKFLCFRSSLKVLAQFPLVFLYLAEFMLCMQIRARFLIAIIPNMHEITVLVPVFPSVLSLASKQETRKMPPADGDRTIEHPFCIHTPFVQQPAITRTPDPNTHLYTSLGWSRMRAAAMNIAKKTVMKRVAETLDPTV